MITFNGRGEWCAGVTGVHWQGGTLWWPGGAAAWLTDDEVFGQRTDKPDGSPEGPARLEAIDVRTAVTHLLLSKPILGAYGDARGHWNALVMGEGYYDSFKRIYPGAAPGPWGPDGSCAIRPNTNALGWDVLEADGRRWRLTDGDAYDVVLYGNRRATFMDGAGVVRAVGMPDPLPLVRSAGQFRYVLVGVFEDLWQLYQTDYGPTLFHPRGDPFGYEVLRGDGFGLAAFARSSTVVRFAWAIAAGEKFADVRPREIDVSTPRVDLRPASVPVPTPEPTPAPTPTPSPIPPRLPPRLPRVKEVNMDHELVDAIGPGGFYATAAGDRLAFTETTPSARTAIEVTKPDSKFTLRFVEANVIVNFPPRWGSGERSGAVDLDRQFETRAPEKRAGHESPTIVELPCGRIIAYVEHDEGGRRFTSVPLTLVRR